MFFSIRNRDPFLKHRGHTVPLPPAAQDEPVETMGESMKRIAANNVKDARRVPEVVLSASRPTDGPRGDQTRGNSVGRKASYRQGKYSLPSPLPFLTRSLQEGSGFFCRGTTPTSCQTRPGRNSIPPSLRLSLPGRERELSFQLSQQAGFALAGPGNSGDP